jgi:hypothetical protein
MNQVREFSIFKKTARRPALLCVLVGGLLIHAASANGQAAATRLIELEQQLQESGGEQEKIERLANNVVEVKADLPSLILMYAGRNLIRLASETRNPPILVTPAGVPLRFDERAGDGGASQIFLVLATMQAPGSEFRKAVNKTISEGDKLAKVKELLTATYRNFSLEALVRIDRGVSG